MFVLGFFKYFPVRTINVTVTQYKYFGCTVIVFFSIFSTLTTIGLYEHNKILFLQRSVELRPQ